MESCSLPSSRLCVKRLIAFKVFRLVVILQCWYHQWGLLVSWYQHYRYSDCSSDLCPGNHVNIQIFLRQWWWIIFHNDAAETTVRRRSDGTECDGASDAEEEQPDLSSGDLGQWQCEWWPWYSDQWQAGKVGHPHQYQVSRYIVTWVGTPWAWYNDVCLDTSWSITRSAEVRWTSLKYLISSTCTWRIQTKRYNKLLYNWFRYGKGICLQRSFWPDSPSYNIIILILWFYTHIDLVLVFVRYFHQTLPPHVLL